MVFVEVTKTTNYIYCLCIIETAYDNPATAGKLRGQKDFM
jgi:hypothetical protein